MHWLYIFKPFKNSPQSTLRYRDAIPVPASLLFFDDLAIAVRKEGMKWFI